MPVLTKTRLSSDVKADTPVIANVIFSRPGQNPQRDAWSQTSRLIFPWNPEQDSSTDPELFDTESKSLVGYVTRNLAVEGVLAIYLAMEEGHLRAWTVIAELNRELRDRIHQAEYRILRELRGLDIDFSVLPRRSNLATLQPPAAVHLIWAKDAGPSDPHRAG